MLMVLAVACGPSSFTGRNTCSLILNSRVVLDTSGSLRNEEAVRIRSEMERVVGAGEEQLCVRVGGSGIVILGRDSIEGGLHGASDIGASRIRISRVVFHPDSSTLLRRVLLHELAHFALASESSVERLPTWYVEGAAHEVASSVTCVDSAFLFVLLTADGDLVMSPNAPIRRTFSDRLLFADPAASHSVVRKIWSAIGRHRLREFHKAIGTSTFEHEVKAFAGESLISILRQAELELRRVAATQPAVRCGQERRPD